MDAAHEIFHKPFEVELKYEKVATPAHYRKYFDGRELPKELLVWRVHGDLKEKNYGLVSDGYGFEDSPDCEYVSGGLNSKGPKSMALGREGNFFLWGFCASPEEMTPAARKVFLNTIVYMKRFDGRKPLVAKKSRSREWALNYARYLGDERLRKYGRTLYGKEILDGTGEDPKKIEALVRADFEYLYVAGGRFVVDADAKALGISNRKRELLERCIAMLAGSRESTRALRLLERYTSEEHGNDAKAWRTWFEQNREQLFFSDVGGYKFFVRPKSKVALDEASGERRTGLQRR